MFCANMPYQKEKIENAIAFFVAAYYEKTKKPLGQTFLYKLLAFLDFETFRSSGEPALGLTYDAMERGPVPEELYKKRLFLESDKYSSRKDGSFLSFFPTPGKKADLSYFYPDEVKEMSRLIDIWAVSYAKANDISETSHRDIKAWKETYKLHPNAKISYEKMFRGDISKRNPESPAEEHFLMTNCLREAEC